MEYLGIDRVSAARFYACIMCSSRFIPRDSLRGLPHSPLLSVYFFITISLLLSIGDTSSRGFSLQLLEKLSTLDEDEWPLGFPDAIATFKSFRLTCWFCATVWLQINLSNYSTGNSIYSSHIIYDFFFGFEIFQCDSRQILNAKFSTGDRFFAARDLFILSAPALVNCGTPARQG